MLQAVESVDDDGDASRERVYVFDGEAVGKGDGDTKHWSSLLASEQDGGAFRWEEVSPEEQGKKPVALNYSSGTTGMPKGVVISHRNIIASTAQLIHTQELDPRDVEERERYISPGFDFIQTFRINYSIIVLPIVVALAKHPLVRSGKYDLSSVTRISVGAAPLSKEVIAEVEALWLPGAFQISQEPPCLSSHPHKLPPQGSVGELQVDCSVKVMNEDGIAEVPRGQQGEIWIKGPNIMQGY
ncbi:MAG: hypothetical protein M1839_003169 [Geoglossum umbratile]|nr:MAG: hypothetical protein M1839_003169 [Geoglossum umbratile]